MSSLYVRDKFRGWFADPAITAICEYHDTINLGDHPSTSLYFTAEFDVDYYERLTICNGRTVSEEGSVEIIFSGLAGRGDATVITAAEQVADLVMQKTDPNGKLTLYRASPPEEFSYGDAMERYMIAIIIEYRYYR